MTTNLELEDIAARLEIRNFLCVMKDELPAGPAALGRTRGASHAPNTTPIDLPVNIISNLQNSDQRGSHLCLLFVDDSQKVYYSSFGDPIPNEAIEFLFALDGRPILTSDIQIQDFSEDTCGL